ncbi:hypothetical protein CVT25_014578 [Psilocybe cyanescens]|uniref:Uncharacterized protein n=1 Tax=Psilocybe cyanescens TaxID=93625 RepID=A0A409WRB2_PSICY|nr:hypothetical protein CVT25_014578 [Psilocybe cyanescens]
MTTSNITFPLELVEAFVEQLAPGSGTISERDILQTVIACTLTSKYFSFAARKRLFSTLVIDWEPTHLLPRITPRSETRTEEEISRRINSFIDLLADERSSDLALMLRSLHIIVDRQQVMLRQATNLHGLLKALSQRAHKLNILRVDSRIFFSWTKIPQETADGLQALCRSLTVKRLILSFIHNIPPVIASAQESPHLRYINFEGSKFGKVETVVVAGSDVLPANVTSGNLDLLGSLPTHGSYEIRYTSDGRIHIVGMDIIIRLSHDSQRLNQLLCDEGVRSSLKYCYWAIDEPFLTTKAIDFGNMILLRQLVIESRIGLSQSYENTRDAITSKMWVDVSQVYEGITDATNTLIDCLYYGNTKSALKEIKVTVSVACVWYRGTSTFDSVDFSPLQRLRIDSLRKKHPLIQLTQFLMNIRLIQLVDGPELNDESRSSFEEHIRDLITDAITITVPPSDEFLLPKIYICAKIVQ